MPREKTGDQGALLMSAEGAKGSENPGMGVRGWGLRGKGDGVGGVAGAPAAGEPRAA